MPKYNYKCFDDKCNYTFEITQSILDPSITKCDKCKKDSIERVMGNVSISFNGSGFYSTDNN